jgi:hypothetical protein
MSDISMTTNPILILYVINAFLFQIVLCVHFTLRKWRLAIAIRHGWMVYALSIPSALVSVILLVTGKAWYYWLAGFLYLVWGVYGYLLEYILKNQSWRSPFHWKVGGSYVILYLAAVMFYWWPLVRIYKPLWYIAACLFLFATILNVSSHNRQNASQEPALGN